MTTTEQKALYADRNPRKLEPHYTAHVIAMTREDLHSKSDIAAELAWRDQQVEALRAQLPDFQGLPKRKLEDLLTQGYRINGFAIAREVEGSDPQRGFITVDGLVGWWTPGLQALERAHEAMEKLKGRIGEMSELLDATTTERDDLRIQVEALKKVADSLPWYDFGTRPAVRGFEVAVNAGALQMVRNALQRDADEGKQSRKEMLAELEATIRPLAAAPQPTESAQKGGV